MSSGKRLLVLIGGVLGVVAAVVGGYRVYVELNGTDTTALVTSCSTPDVQHPKTTCKGRWTVDGSTVSGTVDGVGRRDVGRQVHVTAFDNDAFVDTNWGWSLAALVVGLVVLSAVGFVLWRFRRELAATAPPEDADDPESG